MEVRSQPRDLTPESREPSSLQPAQVSLALDQIRQTQKNLQEMEARLAELTRGCASVLEQWTRTDERHASAVAVLQDRLRDWSEIERRLLSESATRLQQFERNVLHEWHALRQKHEEPLLRLDAQAARINEACLAAVKTALEGFERAEARLETVQQQLQSRFGDLAQEMRDAMAELRAEPPAHQGAPRPWALDEVVRIHGQIRAEADDRGGKALVPAAPVARADARPPEERTPEPALAPAGGRGWRLALAAIGIAVVLVAAYAWQLRRQMAEGLQAAAARADAAERSVEQAQAGLAAAQEAAGERIRSAEAESARMAALTAGILAAPDVRQLDLVPAGTGQGASARMLWSRSRGSVLSGTRLPQAGTDRVYQVWLHGREAAVSAGVFAPDAEGHASAVFESPDRLPWPVVGATVTVEPAGGSARPTGPAVLTTFAADTAAP